VFGPERVRLPGLAGLVGGLAWAGLVVLSFAAGRGSTLLGYETLDLLAPVVFALVVVGVAGYYARTQTAWGRATTAGFVVFFAGLLGALAGSTAYVVAGFLAGWTLSVWSYFLALVGAVVFGAGLLWNEVPPRSGAVLLAVALPAGLGISLAVAVGGLVPDEAVVPVGPGALLGIGIAALGWWVAARSDTASDRT
jgi:peptidoglycan/LPS O-acetylase OafA/YrhL